MPCMCTSTFVYTYAGCWQCVAVCCSVLQSHNFSRGSRALTAACSVLQCVAVCCSVLQCVAVCYVVLQCVAMCCIVLQSHDFSRGSRVLTAACSSGDRGAVAPRVVFMCVKEWDRVCVWVDCCNLLGNPKHIFTPFARRRSESQDEKQNDTLKFAKSQISYRFPRYSCPRKILGENAVPQRKFQNRQHLSYNRLFQSLTWPDPYTDV